MVYCVVTMMVKEGRMDDFLAECKKIRPIVLKENGCLMYDYAFEFDSGMTRQEAINPNRVTLFEKWESLDAINAHSATPHMKEYGERVNDLRESVVIRAGHEAF
jgi:quinol monooxygenase YgiN